VLCLIVVPLPLGKNPFAVKINNNNKKKEYEILLFRIVARLAWGPTTLLSNGHQEFFPEE
jgi:hypothetical protein